MANEMSGDRRALRQPGLFVYLAGLGTSALVLWAVRRLDAADVHVLGWYANGILPVGALLVGILSGAGYAVASYFLNVKLTRAFVIGMLTTGLADYAMAQHLAYTGLLEEHHASPDAYPFLRFLTDQCEQMTFTRSGSSSTGSPLGAFGYFWKALEVAGFAGGTMIPSAALFAMPYCKGCQQYLKQLSTAYLHTHEQRAALFALPRKERPAALGAAVTELVARTGLVTARLSSSPTLAETRAILAELDAGPRKQAAKEAVGVVVALLKKCPGCEAHHVDLTLTHVTLDKKSASRSLAKLDRT